MIDFRELRPGNYLQGKPISIPKMGWHGDGTTRITSYGIYMLEENTELDYNPIPLTEEWLIKFGFRQDFTYKYRWAIGTFVIHLMMVDSENEKLAYHLALDYGQMLRKPIFSVHQLQNLYYSLTGKELEIKQ